MCFLDMSDNLVWRQLNLTEYREKDTVPEPEPEMIQVKSRVKPEL